LGPHRFALDVFHVVGREANFRKTRRLEEQRPEQLLVQAIVAGIAGAGIDAHFDDASLPLGSSTTRPWLRLNLPRMVDMP
jgi:hypothetical protein